MPAFRFSVHASAAPTMSAWRDQARLAEDLGYSSLYIADHFGTQFGPLVALAVAAEATSTLNVGTMVLSNDLRNPVVLAKEIATLGLAAEGRVEVGLGAGWLPADYEQTGIEFDKASVRVARLAESLALVTALWRHGKATLTGEHYTVRDARCDPRPASPPRIIVGGGSRRVLSIAAKHADTIGVNTSLARGFNIGELAGQATFDHYDRCIGWIREAAPERFDSIELQLMAAAAKIVGSRRAAARTATILGLPGEDALEVPIVLIGSVDEVCERLIGHRERWGFSNIVVPGDAMEAFAPVVAQLSGT